MAQKLDFRLATLARMILGALQVLRLLRGYCVARRTEETSRGRLALNHGTLYRALLELEQEGLVTAEWSSLRVGSWRSSTQWPPLVAADWRAQSTTGTPRPTSVRATGGISRLA